MFYRDVMRAFDAIIGEIEAAGEAQKKTGWMRQAWHRRLTWSRWLRELRAYVEGQETMALARIVEINSLKEALAARAFIVCTCRHDSGASSDCAVHGTNNSEQECRHHVPAGDYCPDCESMELTRFNQGK